MGKDFLETAKYNDTCDLFNPQSGGHVRRFSGSGLQMGKSNRPRQKLKVSFRKKMLFSALTTILFFVTLECALTLVGVQPTTNNEDPFVGFSGLLPLMELSTNEQGGNQMGTLHFDLASCSDF